MKKLTAQEDTELAEEHWKWLSEVLKRIYIDAMVHGIKHGQEGKNDRFTS